jgi:uncharacterized protein YcbX
MQVVQLWRYPVKSLGGEPLHSARFETGGISHDRRIAVMDSDPTRVGKPLTGRRQHQLLAYSSKVRDGDVFVCTPSGKEYAVSDASWMAELEADVGQPASLKVADEPIHDDADVLVLNAASLRALTEEYGSFVHPLRFRPNVIVDGHDISAFDELGWLGIEFSIGDAVLYVSHPCARCVLTTVEPETLVADPSFLKLVVQSHEGRFGVYCKVVRAGDVRIGDEWRARRAPEVQV